MRIIDKLSIENNLSNSKIISILVEEALSMRGIFNKKNGKSTQSYQSNIVKSKNLIDIKLESHFKSNKSTHLNNASQEDFDLQTYKKFLSFLKFQEMMEKYKP